MILTLEELAQAARKFQTKQIEVAALGGSVYVRQVTSGELNELQMLCKQHSEGRCPNFHAKCCAIFLSDENGKRLYTDQQTNVLAGFNGRALDDIFTEGMMFNSVIDMPIEELEKN